MLRSSNQVAAVSIKLLRRFKSTVPPFSKQDLDIFKVGSVDRESSHIFGKVVEGEESSGDYVVERDDYMQDQQSSPYREASGALIRGQNAKEARILQETIVGRAPRDQIQLNPAISQAIGNNILSLHIPNNLRRSAGNKFVELKQNKLHKPARSNMEVDSHIASLFLQNYGAIYQSLNELKKRLGSDFNPDRVLDVGYGPATGMVALNDLMGNDFRPSVKDAVIVGHVEMQKRAKIILSRQINETPTEASGQNSSEVGEEDEIMADNDLVGEVMTKKIKIVTKLRDSLPRSKQYDLIILTHQLLQTEEQFPVEVDMNLEQCLRLLAPGGHIVLVERGNPLGFESIARAREVVLRPQNYPDEHGKIPRPWRRGSSVKKQHDHELVNEFNEKFDDLSLDELESKDQAVAAAAEAKQTQEDFYMKVIAPCPHHRKCPLQVSKPQYYELGEGKDLKFCNFQKSVLRPKYAIELKKGRILATPWQSNTEPIGVKGMAQPGTGRPHGRNFEVLSYSYLIMERSKTDEKTLGDIVKRREQQNEVYGIGSLGNNTVETWPRIIKQPLKRKGHVVLDLCGASGQLEKWTVPRSLSKEIYHDARKAMKGDLWGLEAKTKTKGMGDLNVEKLENAERERIREARRQAKRSSRELKEAVNAVDYEDAASTEEGVAALAAMYGNEFEGSVKPRKLKRGPAMK